MLHWRAKLLGLGLLLCLAAGCKQPMFIAEKDLQRLGDMLPANLEKDPMTTIRPTLDSVPTPPNVDNPDRPPRYISLEEMIAISLENGSPNSIRAGEGLADDRLASFPVGTASASETVRVLALNPAIAYTAIENQLARYDAQWTTTITSNSTDSVAQGLQSFQNGQSAAFATGFFKALPSGGVANLGFQTDYRLLSSPPTGSFGVLNPSYTTKLVLGIEQPLWKDYGVDINQLLQRHPQTSLLNNPGIRQFDVHQNSLNPFSFGQSGSTNGPEGVLISRIRYGQHKAEFERQMHLLVLNVEVAYWNLYRAYGKLHSATEVFRIAHRVWMAAHARFIAGNMPPSEYYRVLELVHETRAQRQTALSDVLEKERNLRRLAGMPIEDGSRLVLITAPNKAQYLPNFEAAVKDAMVYRPELALVREQLRSAHLVLLREKNSVKPDIRAIAQYFPTGFGTRLDGNGSFKDGIGIERPNNAFRSLASDHFNDWTIGLVANVPLGYRAELANIRAARLILAQSYYLVKDQEERAKSYVTQQWQALSTAYSLIEMRAGQRDASQKGAVALIRAVEIGKEKYDINLLDVIRRLGTSMDSEYDAIFEYNNALARFYWSTGTTLHHNNIYLSEGPLPACAQVRAVEHEKERTKARVLRERPRPLDQPGWFDHVHGDGPGELNLREPAPAEMPRKLEPTPGLPAPQTTPEKLPTPSKLPAALAPESVAPPAQSVEFRREPMSNASKTVPLPAPPSPLKSAPVANPVPPAALPGVPARPIAPPPAVDLPPLPSDFVVPELPRVR